MGVAHRDLKPENILLDTVHLTDGLPTAKIADFGLAKMGEYKFGLEAPRGCPPDVVVAQFGVS